LAAISYVELKDLQIAARIGTYGPDDVVPDAHLLDLTLEYPS
jgi:dihydroneopterin aldolase